MDVKRHNLLVLLPNESSNFYIVSVPYFCNFTANLHQWGNNVETRSRTAQNFEFERFIRRWLRECIPLQSASALVVLDHISWQASACVAPICVQVYYQHKNDITIHDRPMHNFTPSTFDLTDSFFLATWVLWGCIALSWILSYNGFVRPTWFWLDMVQPETLPTLGEEQEVLL